MERFKRGLSMRKKKDATPESSKPHQWQEDEQKVRDATCSFQVKVCSDELTSLEWGVGTGDIYGLMYQYF